MGFSKPKKYLQEVRDLLDELELEEQLEGDQIDISEMGFILGYKEA